jgi:hypothetical protein
MRGFELLAKLGGALDEVFWNAGYSVVEFKDSESPEAQRWHLALVFAVRR